MPAMLRSMQIPNELSLALRAFLSCMMLTCVCCLDVCGEEAEHSDEHHSHSICIDHLVLNTTPPAVTFDPPPVSFAVQWLQDLLSDRRSGLSISPNSGDPPEPGPLFLRLSRLVI